MFKLTISCVAEFYFRFLNSCLGLVKLGHILTTRDITQIFKIFGGEDIHYVLVYQIGKLKENILEV